MKRKIIRINSELCNGCGACVSACHEGAIGMVDGKARLLRDDYCDGLGDCLPACPTGAITFEEREALPYNEEAVKANQQAKQAKKLPCGCPSMNYKSKTNWPVQIKLVPVRADYFEGAELLIAADCVAFAYAEFHSSLKKNRVTLIGCPKLDMTDYADKLSEIIKNNNIKSIIVARMEVPCCGGIEAMTKNALQLSGKLIPWQVITITTDGKIKD